MSAGRLSVLLILLAACKGDPDPEVWELSVEGSRLVLAPGGWVDLYDREGRLVVGHAVAEVVLDATDETGTPVRTDGRRERVVEYRAVGQALGEAEQLVLTVIGEGGEPDLVWTIAAFDDRRAYTFEVVVDNHSGGAVQVARTSPLHVDARDGGGLYLGADPATHRILENGSYAALDFAAEVVPGDVPWNEGWSAIAPGDFEGHSVSNWNHAVVDLESEAAWVAGALSFTATMPVINLSYRPDLALEDDGRTGFSLLSAESAWLPEPKPVEDGESLGSELFYIRPTPADPLAGLEDYAQAVADHLGLVPWHRRVPGRRVPNGWNSWSTSSSTGGYGTGIDEEIVLDNLDVMATQLRDWGMDWYQIDDGWQVADGDWQWNDKFPHGPAWLSQQIRDRGLRPGLWISPFTVARHSQLLVDHPEWMADRVLLGEVVVGDQEILDLSHPEVHAWLDDLFTTFRHEWGYEWLKLDFGYLAMFGTDLYEPTWTREQSWRSAMGVIDEAMGDDAFFLGIGTMGTNYDLVDAGRTTLDNMPIWDWPPGIDADDHLSQQGFKPTLRTAGRRWYLQDRVWVNHPDLIVFRSNTRDDSWPRVTFEEARAFCSFVGLSGGIVKLGDRLVDLGPDELNTIRALLPVYGVSARPLDVFTREFPEVWHLSVDEPLDGLDASWELVGLFDWGWNKDMSVNPFVVIPDDGEPLVHQLDLAELGLDGSWLAYEFWTQEFLGEVSGTLEVEVPSHDGRVVALRPAEGVPQFLGWNRQITMGGTLVQAADWDGEELVFAAQVAQPTVEAPFVYEVAFHVPDGFAAGTPEWSGQSVTDVEVVDEGEVLRLRFVPEGTGELEVAIPF